MNGFKITDFYRHPILYGKELTYEPGKTYSVKGKPKATKWGYHFTTNVWHVYKTCGERCWNRIFNVVPQGDISHLGTTCATDTLLFGNELMPDEIVYRMLEEYKQEPEDDVDKARVAIQCFLTSLWHSANATKNAMRENLRNGYRLAKATDDWRAQWRQAFELNKNNELVDHIMHIKLGAWQS